MKALEKLRKLDYIMFVDDERAIGNSIIVVLQEGWYFVDEPDCGVRGFGTVSETVVGCSANKVFYKAGE